MNDIQEIILHTVKNAEHITPEMQKVVAQYIGVQSTQTTTTGHSDLKVMAKLFGDERNWKSYQEQRISPITGKPVRKYNKRSK